MKCPPGSLLLLIATLLGPLSPTRAGEETRVRLYDVGAIVTSDDSVSEEPLGLLGPVSEALSPFDDEDDEDEGPPAFLEPEGLVTLLRLLVPALSGDAGEWKVYVEGTHLQVEGSQAMHVEVRRALSTLWAAAAQRIEIEAHWLCLDSAGRARLESSGLLQALLAGRVDETTAAKAMAQAEQPGCRHEIASSVVRPGHRAVLGQVAGVSYVRDYSVEIAQDSRVGDPDVDRIVEGWRSEIRPYPLADGSVYLEVSLQVAALERPIRRRALEVQPFGDVDLPALAALRTAGVMRIPSGEMRSWVTAPAPGGEALGVFLVRVARRGPALDRQPLRRFDASGLLHEVSAVALGARLTPDPLAPPAFVRTGTSRPVVERDRLLEEVLHHVGGMPEDVWIGLEGDGLWIQGDASVCEHVASALARLEAPLVGERLQVRAAIRNGDGTPCECALAALDVPAGRAVGWLAGDERAYVADWEVEVAQEVRSGDPVVRTAFGGLTFGARLEAAPDPDRAALDLRLAFSELARDLETLRPRNECTGILEVPSVIRVDLVQDLVLHRGRPVRIEGGTLGGGRRLDVEVTLGR